MKRTKETTHVGSQMELSKPFPRERLEVKDGVVDCVISNETYFRKRITGHGSQTYGDRGKVCLCLSRRETWIEKAE